MLILQLEPFTDEFEGKFFLLITFNDVNCLNLDGPHNFSNGKLALMRVTIPTGLDWNSYVELNIAPNYFFDFPYPTRRNCTVSPPTLTTTRTCATARSFWPRANSKKSSELLDFSKVEFSAIVVL